MLKISPIIILPYIFTLTAWKIAKRPDQQRLILEAKKPASVPM
jgi:hypothetical protein